jgi:hypothetical protein
MKGSEMKNGTCPKCSAATVYKRAKGMSFVDGGVHVFAGGVCKPTPLESFICTSCGYVESYLVDAAKLEGRFPRVDQGRVRRRPGAPARAKEAAPGGLAGMPVV